MKALSIKQPWAHLIAAGIKDIENRTWRTNFRGRIYIHASGKVYPFFKGNNLAFPVDQWEVIKKRVDVHKQEEHDKFFLTSAIIGEVDIVDCVINHSSIWAEKTPMNHYPIPKDKKIYNWVLANPILYDKPILNVKGKLSFWEFRELKECRCCTNNEADEELHVCERCEQEFCSYCQAPYNQFSQIDYNCCNYCADKDDKN
ncbi:ASCH domain-containing protein [Flavobacterium sp. CF136]|uniref:ASCH domain-containing protein n=1 Tax=Flavobacterium sp. (strain CF136) TaxID=1144313 RepID=UPI0002719F05|nr:ASCH domain-containing protein [Flavobacterium sp. CF136]EJL66291.1 ASCH domain-containing protein [Flavobacterium sp. CF136]